MDLGRDESAAWEGGYPVWGQGNDGEGLDEV